MGHFLEGELDALAARASQAVDDAARENFEDGIIYVERLIVKYWTYADCSQDRSCLDELLVYVQSRPVI